VGILSLSVSDYSKLIVNKKVFIFAIYILRDGSLTFWGLGGVVKAID
jgi:hypothetical protein